MLAMGAASPGEAAPQAPAFHEPADEFRERCHTSHPSHPSYPAFQELADDFGHDQPQAAVARPVSPRVNPPKPLLAALGALPEWRLFRISGAINLPRAKKNQQSQ
jgi:hypothetical protein